MNKLSKASLIATAATVLAVTFASTGTKTLAQGLQTPSAGLIAFNACTTINLTDTAAKTLSITAVELRKDIVSGKSVQDIATSKNVNFQTLADALQAARKTAIDQAVKDGILTQTEATALESRGQNPGGQGNPQQGTPGAKQGQPGGQQGGQGNPNAQGAPNGQQGGPGGQNAPQGNPNPQGGPANAQGTPPAAITPLPDINNMSFLLQVANTTTPTTGNPGRNGFRLGGPGGENFNLVQPYVVTAKALNISCADLVKTLAGTSGKSIAAVAADKQVTAQTVVDALTNAYKAALAQDVTDTVITQAQSDQLSATLDKAVTAFVNNTSPLQMGPRGGPR